MSYHPLYESMYKIVSYYSHVKVYMMLVRELEVLREYIDRNALMVDDMKNCPVGKRKITKQARNAGRIYTQRLKQEEELVLTNNVRPDLRDLLEHIATECGLDLFCFAHCIAHFTHCNQQFGWMDRKKYEILPYDPKLPDQYLKVELLADNIAVHDRVYKLKQLNL